MQEYVLVAVAAWVGGHSGMVVQIKKECYEEVLADPHCVLPKVVKLVNYIKLNALNYWVFTLKIQT